MSRNVSKLERYSSTSSEEFSYARSPQRSNARSACTSSRHARQGQHHPYCSLVSLSGIAQALTNLCRPRWPCCSGRFQMYMLLLPKFKKFIREFEINVWVILIATTLKKTRFQIHSILIGDKKTQLFRGINSDYLWEKSPIIFVNCRCAIPVRSNLRKSDKIKFKI